MRAYRRWRNVRVWRVGRYALHVARFAMGARAVLYDLHEGGDYAESIDCRSHSRAVDVGRRMLALAISRGRIVRLA